MIIFLIRSRILPGLMLLFFMKGVLPAQQIAKLGHWTSYLSHYDVREITVQAGKAFAITTGGLFYYDMGTTEIRTYTTVNGLSGINPASMYYAPESKLVFIGFPNGMVNYFFDPDNIKYITDINRNELYPNKTIFEFLEHDGYIYMATEFGMVVYDITKLETKYSVTKFSTLNTGTPVKDVSIIGDSIWVSIQDEGVFKTSLSLPNLTIPSIWEKASGTNGLPDEPCEYLANTNDILYALVKDTIFRKYPGTPWFKSPFPIADYNYLNSNWQGSVFACHTSISQSLQPDSSLIVVNDYGTLNCNFMDWDLMLMGDEYVGMQVWSFGEKTGVTPKGPNNNFVSQIAVGEREFYIAPRGRKGPSERYFDKSGIYYYKLDSGWKVLDHLTATLDTGTIYQDFCRAYFDRDTRKAYLGSWGDGILVLRNGDTLKSYTQDNSPISSNTLDGSSRVSGLATDENGTLWVSLMLAEYPLNAMDINGNWFYFPLTASVQCVNMILDDYGNVWMNNYLNGLAVFSDGGTLLNTADDKIKFLTAASGSGGLPNVNVYSMVKDLDGQIWVGTNEGVTVFYDPGSIFYSGFQDASCPISEGFCLLRDQKINAMAVDGANRKWIGTENGIYLISDDGTEQILHFDTDNSPLPNNVIRDIAIDPATGEVLIGTDLGLVSYIGDATEGKITSDSMMVFPNPIRPDFNGLVVIRGSIPEAKIKITNIAGHLVRELNSNGGETTWDMLDKWGERVKPGIYLVMVGDREGKGPGITKIVMLDKSQ